MSDFAIPQQPERAGLSVGKILERVWVLLKTGWMLYVTLGSLLICVMLLMEARVIGVMFSSGAFPRPGSNSIPPAAAQQMFRSMMPMTGVLELLFLVLYALFQSAACRAALEANRGRSVTISQALSKALNGLWRYTWLGILKCLAIVIPLGAVLVPVGAAFAIFIVRGGGISKGAEFFLLPLLLLALFAAPVFAVWMALKLSLAFPACVGEDIPARESLKRSNFLTRRAKGRIFLVALVVYAINYAIILAIEMVGLLLFSVGALLTMGFHLHWSRLPSVAAFVVAGLVLLASIVVLMALTMSAVAIALSVLYDDQRFRLEAVALAAGKPALG